MRKVIVTTAGRPDEESFQLAKQISEELHVRYVPRKKRSVAKIGNLYQANVIVAGKNRFEYYAKGSSTPFFFHPDTAAFRLKRLERGETEPFIESCGLQPGDSFLDCTLGIGSDAIIASFAVGESGKVVGVEVDPIISYLVRRGLKEYETTDPVLKQAMERIQVIHAEAVEFLKKQPDSSFDVVYLDPMFEETIEESNNFESLREVGSHHPLTEEWVKEAYRVAKKRVVLKAHFRSTHFEDLGFERKVRLTSKFHYGVLEKINC